MSQVGSRHHSHRPLPDDLRPGHGPQPRQFSCALNEPSQVKLPGLQKRRIQPGLRLRCSGLGRLADLVGADNVAHHVSLIAVQSDAAATLLPGQPVQAVKHVEVIGQTARAAMGELRRLLGVLRTPASAGRQPPDTAPLPSVSQLGKVLDQVREAGISVDLWVEGSTARLAPAVDLAAYRIVQEALTNTVRHSGADKAAVTLRYEPGYVTASVTDTGHGPAAAAGPPGTGSTLTSRSRGFGLAGMAERVASCGGSLTVGPGQAGGVAVTARLPAPSPPQGREGHSSL